MRLSVFSAIPFPGNTSVQERVNLAGLSHCPGKGLLTRLALGWCLGTWTSGVSTVPRTEESAPWAQAVCTGTA